MFNFLKPKPQKWLGNKHSGVVHTIGKIKNQCNVDDMSAQNWQTLENVIEFNDFLGQPWHITGVRPHMCIHCFGR